MKIAYLALSVRRKDNDAGFTHSYHISRALAKRAEVVFFLSGTRPHILEPAVPRTVELRLPSSLEAPLHPVAYARSLRLALKELEGADVIHERFRFNPMDLLLLQGRKYLLELNDLACMGLGGMWKGLRMRVAQRKLKECRALVTQTETLRGIVQGLTKKPVYVIPNGVDTEMFGPSAVRGMRRIHGIGEDEIVVLYVGSMRPWHGIRMIVEAAREIGRARNDVRFVMIGSGPLLGEAQRLSQGVRNVLFAGSVPMEKVPGCISDSDICIAPFSGNDFPPLNEFGFWWCPVKIFEYMSCGRPVVTMDYPELSKIVEDAGLLAAPDDGGDFTGKILALIDDESLRKRMGERGRALALLKHSWERGAEMLLSIYTSL
jgi:glycosyltransferase involved in cell wall biosynthesis